MGSFSRVAVLTASFSLLAGCSGGHGASVLPADSTAQTSGLRNAASVTTPTSGTLYVATIGSVTAYPLGASDPTPNVTTAATRTITPHAKQTQNIFGVAVNTDDTIDILETYYTGPNSNQTQQCRVVVEPADADGANTPALATNLCTGTAQSQADAIAPNLLGGYDVLSNRVASDDGPNTIVRYTKDGAAIDSTLTLSTYPYMLATDRGGHDYETNDNGPLQFYRNSATSASDVAFSADTSSIGQLWALAVSPGADRTVYVAEGQIDGSMYVDALTLTPPSTYTMQSQIGPFTNYIITAMAVDAQGELYVGLEPNGGGNGCIIRVYDPSATGKTAPLRIIRPSPGIYQINGLAIAN